MSVLLDLVAGLRSGAIEVVDLTAPLSEGTPIIKLPPELGQPWLFAREVISHYDEAGPEVYWNNIRLSEHTGTHFDAPVHWLPGKDHDDVSTVPVRRLVAPAAVLDFTEEANADPDFLLRREHVEAWQDRHGALPDAGWLLYRTGWDARVDDADRFLNDGHTPGVQSECAKWLAEETSIVGIGVETVGTDAGQAMTMDQPFPCHYYFQGANKYGLTQLQNLKLLPAQGAVVIVSPLPIVGGSGSPSRVLALLDTTA
jgi:kynurenine formamidase